MNKLLAITVIASIGVMMVSGMMPSIAQPDIQPYEPRRGQDTGIPLKYEPRSCVKNPNGDVSCIVFIDTNDNGCDNRDRRISMQLTAIENANIPTCDH